MVVKSISTTSHVEDLTKIFEKKKVQHEAKPREMHIQGVKRKVPWLHAYP